MAPSACAHLFCWQQCPLAKGGAGLCLPVRAVIHPALEPLRAKWSLRIIDPFQSISKSHEHIPSASTSGSLRTPQRVSVPICHTRV